MSSVRQSIETLIFPAVNAKHALDSRPEIANNPLIPGQIARFSMLGNWKNDGQQAVWGNGLKLLCDPNHELG
jgi:hypothetical protein